MSVEIAKTLKEVMALYQKAIQMDFEEKERLVLQYIGSFATKHDELDCVKEACDDVLKKWRERYPHDSTLLDEASKMVDYPFKKVFPDNEFDEDMMVYKLFDTLIKKLFDDMLTHSLGKHDKMILNQLWRAVHNTLIENPNFKGENPFYKRHRSEYSHAKKQWVELLDRDYNNYISYFEEEIEA